jgi:hypothetical protein
MTWQPIGSVAPDSLVDARVQVHFAAQLVAAVCDALAAPLPDSSHKALRYDPVANAFVGCRIEGARPFHPALVLPTLTLRLEADDGVVIDALPLIGRTDQDALAWLQHHAAVLGGHAAAIAMHRYDADFPSHPVGEGAAYDLAPEDPGLRELAAYYADTWALLEPLTAAGGTTPARIWPHHLDLATLIAAGTAADGDDRTVGVGLSPGDGIVAEPYWYVSAWPQPEATELPDPAGPENWRAEPWFGALLTGSSMLAATGRQEDIVSSFVERAVETSRALLTE